MSGVLRPYQDELSLFSHQARGDNYRDIGRYKDALICFEAAEKLARKLKSRESQCFATNSIGIVYEDQKKHRDALVYHKLALELVKKHKLEKNIEGKILGNIGIVLKNIGGSSNILKAIRVQKNVLRIAQNTGDKRSEGRTFGNLAIAHSDLGDKANAFSCYESAYKVAIDLADKYHQAVWKANMGIDLFDFDGEIAKKYLNEAIEIFRKIGSQHYVEYCEAKLSEPDDQ